MTKSVRTMGGVASPAQLAMGAVVLIAALAAAGLLNSYYVFVLGQIALLAIVGIGLNLLIGLSGQISFGHAGFYALGAYVVAVLTTRSGVSFWIAWPLGALLTAGLGAVLALPALRVKGPYLAMVTIAFGLIVQHTLIEMKDVTGGQNGILDIPSPMIAGLRLGDRGLAMLALLTAGLALAAYQRLANGAWGAALRAVRDSDVAAASIGLDATRIRTVAFAVSAALAGLAGGLFAPLAAFVTPETFGLNQSIVFVLVVVIGGQRAGIGPVLGAAVVGLLPELLSSLEAFRILAFAILVLVVLWMAPDGVAGLLLRRRSTASTTDQVPAADLATLLTPRVRHALSAHELGMTFGGVRAVNSATFTMPPGRITALIGPNGAGKSTVMNMLSGFYRPSRGACRLGEGPLPVDGAFRVARRGIARTYQTSQLFDGLSVEDNVRIGLRQGRLGGLLGGGRAAADLDRAHQLLAACGYHGDPASSAADLPHVDRRLVEIARALATDPDVLLLDEPAAGLSQAEKRNLGRLLQTIAAAGVAVGLVEHDMALVMGVSDHVVVLNAGVQIAEGSPAQVQADPAVREAYLGAAPTSAVRVPKPNPAPRRDALRVVGLTAGYGGAPVLKNVEIEVRQGEAVALLGANGAGKSTLMRVLSGLQTATQGDLLLEGVPIKTLAADRRVRMGLVLSPEGRQVFPELSVRDNIRLGGFVRRRGLEARLETMIDRFPKLRDRLRQRAGLLSGGEQQMLALARALMAEPRLLLLDEPSLGLAPRVIAELFNDLERLRLEGMTLVIVDQMAGLALSLADRAYVLSDGEIVAQGSAASLANDPKLSAAYLGGS